MYHYKVDKTSNKKVYHNCFFLSVQHCNIDLVNWKTPNNTKQKHWRKKHEKQQEFIYCKRKWRGIHCEEHRLCATASNNILESAIREEDYAVCYCQPHCEEDILCVTVSLIVKKICCVLLPTSLWRRYAVCYFQPHCEEDIAVYFYKCVYQKELLWCLVTKPGGFVWVGHASNKK